MDEPEFGEKVTASTYADPRRRTFVRFRADQMWAWTNGGDNHNWIGLIDPQPVSPI
jgi:hypothetical protein